MLAIDRVSKDFHRDGQLRPALEAVSMIVGQGEIVSVVGTSGCGKSTLLRIVAGLDKASTGAVKLEGRVITAPAPEIGVVFQEPRLMPWLTVRENVRLGLLSLPKDEQQHRIETVLKRVGLAPYAEALPRQLSGGMAQRVAIARALARQPRLLLLDEPFSALDAFTRQSLQEHLLQLWSEGGLTLLLVTHDLEEALALSHRILVLRGQPGRVHSLVTVPHGRPRLRSAPAFQRQKEELSAALDLAHHQV